MQSQQESQPTMRKYILHIDYGGFSLSKQAIQRIAQLKNITAEEASLQFNYCDKMETRCDSDLIKVMEELGKDAESEFNQSKSYSRFSIDQISADIDLKYIDIKEYDGAEWIELNYDKVIEDCNTKGMSDEDLGKLLRKVHKHWSQ